ncbi:MAG: hypothetical protein ACYTG2_18110 [Planctomycetota bacterium]|jgi:hypothetical protein
MKATAGVAWRTAVACAALVGTIGSVEAQSICLGYNDVGTWYESADCQATVCSDGTQAGVLEFKDEDGEVLQTVSMEAAGCVSVPIPHGTTNYDWKLKNPPPPPEPLAFPVPGLGGGLPGGGGLDASHHLVGVGTVTLGCLSTQVLRDEPAFAYAFRVHAKDFGAADALVSPILQSGPGAPVPPSVIVGSFVTLSHDGQTATIRSSLPDRFEFYVIDVDGEVLADLEAGLAAEARSAGNGWTTVTTRLPLSAASAGQTVTLRQKARHDAEAVELILEL